MPLPRVHFEGHLTRSPELRFLQDGTAVASFAVACNDRRKNQAGEWEDGDATFVDCSAWRDLAEHVAESLHKGDNVVVTGKLAQRKYTNKEGVEVTTFGVTVETIGPSLRWTDVTVKPKAQRTQAPPPPQDDPWSTQQSSEPPF